MNGNRYRLIFSAIANGISPGALAVLAVVLAALGAALVWRNLPHSAPPEPARPATGIHLDNAELTKLRGLGIQ